MQTQMAKQGGPYSKGGIQIREENRHRDKGKHKTTLRNDHMMRNR